MVKNWLDFQIASQKRHHLRRLEELRLIEWANEWQENLTQREKKSLKYQITSILSMWDPWTGQVYFLSFSVFEGLAEQSANRFHIAIFHHDRNRTLDIVPFVENSHFGISFRNFFVFPFFWFSIFAAAAALAAGGWWLSCCKNWTFCIIFQYPEKLANKPHATPIRSLYEPWTSSVRTPNDPCKRPNDTRTIP